MLSREEYKILTWLHLHESITHSSLRPLTVRIPAEMTTNYRVDVSPALADRPDWLPPFNGAMLIRMAKFTDWWTDRMRSLYKGKANRWDGDASISYHINGTDVPSDWSL